MEEKEKEGKIRRMQEEREEGEGREEKEEEEGEKKKTNEPSHIIGRPLPQSVNCVTDGLDIFLPVLLRIF